jgi:cytochrome P450
MTAEIAQILHALFLFPETLEKVFKELQTVTQDRRLPPFSDRAKMPYTVAVFKEAIRWRPIFPIGQ